MATHIAQDPNLGLKFQLLGKKFELQSAFPGSLGLSEFASYTESGQTVTSPVFPWILLFQPNPALTAKMSSNTNLDVTHVLTSMANGNEILYKIWAVANPSDTSATYIGYIQLQTPFVESEFSDLTLFFKHTFIEDDFAIRQDWQTYFSDPTAKRWETDGQKTFKRYLLPWSSTSPQ